jgi:hypothetical protein
MRTKQTKKPIYYKDHKVREQTTEVKGHEYTRYAVDFGTDEDGNRNRRTFTTTAKAKAAIREHLDKSATDTKARTILKKRIGEKANRLTTDHLLDAASALDTLKGSASLNEAARFYIKHTTPPDGGKHTIKELADAYVESKAKANLSPYTVRDARDMLSPFARQFGDMQIAEISSTEIESWHDRQSQGQDRKYKRRNMLVGMFNYAVARNYRIDNPAEILPSTKIRRKKTSILTVKDAENLILYAADNYPEMVPYFALCMFAGVRPRGEMEKLDWADLDFSEREIFISEEVSKTNDERCITMTDALVAWLLPYRQDSGSIYYSRYHFEQVRKGARVRWSKDVMRHSFGSYHLAMWKNMGDTMEQMGDTNVRTYKNHYRRAIKGNVAPKFWSIRPEADGNVIAFPKTA